MAKSDEDYSSEGEKGDEDSEWDDDTRRKSPCGHGAAKSKSEDSASNPKYANKQWVRARVRDTRTGRVTTQERMIQSSTYYEGSRRYFMYDGEYDCQQFDGFKESEIVGPREDANDTAESSDEMESAQHAAKQSDKRCLKGTNRTEKQKAGDDSKKGVFPKQLESAIAKIHEAGQGQLGPKLLSLTELSVSMPPVGALEQDLLDWGEKVSSVIIEFKLDGCNEGGLRAEDDEYTPWEKLGGVEEQLSFVRKAHELMTNIGLDFLSGRDPEEGDYYGIKWLANGKEDLATLLGFYSSSETSKSGNDVIRNGYVNLYKMVNRLGSTDGLGSTFLVRMFKGQDEVHVYHHTLRPGEEFSNMLTHKSNTTTLEDLSAPLGFELEDDDSKKRDEYLKTWKRMLSFSDRQHIIEEINRIADSEESNDVPITRAKPGTKTTDGYNRLINWLNLKFPSKEAAKKVPSKKAPVGLELNDDDSKKRDEYLMTWKRMLSSEKKARLIQQEINKLADSSEIPIAKAKLGRGGTNATEGYNRLINWLNLKFPSKEAAKKIPRKAPAKKKTKTKAPAKKRKAVEPAEPATKSEATKKKHAVKPTCSAELKAEVAAVHVDPEKKAKLEAAVASVTDGKVGANELQDALDAGYSEWFILALAEEETS